MRVYTAHPTDLTLRDFTTLTMLDFKRFQKKLRSIIAETHTEIQVYLSLTSMGQINSLLLPLSH